MYALPSRYRHSADGAFPSEAMGPPSGVVTRGRRASAAGRRLGLLLVLTSFLNSGYVDLALPGSGTERGQEGVKQGSLWQGCNRPGV